MARRFVSAALVVLLVAAALVVLTRLGGLLPELDQPELTVDMVLSRMQLAHGQDGKLGWELSAATARMFQGRSTMDLDGPQVRYYTADGGALIIRSAKGEVDQAKNAMRLVSEVVGVYKDAALNAREMIFDGKDLVTATGDVRMVQDGAVLRAPTVHYSLSKGVFTALDGVELTLPRPRAGE